MKAYLKACRVLAPSDLGTQIVPDDCPSAGHRVTGDASAPQRHTQVPLNTTSLVALLDTSDTGRNIEQMQSGAGPFTAARYTSCAWRYWTRYSSGSQRSCLISQRSCLISGALGARYFDSVIILAALFWSLYSPLLPSPCRTGDPGSWPSACVQ